MALSITVPWAFLSYMKSRQKFTAIQAAEHLGVSVAAVRRHISVAEDMGHVRCVGFGRPTGARRDSYLYEMVK